jgi:hypothetical protein
MPLTIPKPILLMPKVPGLLVIGLLAVQYLLFQSGNGPEPKCTVNVERPHHSTSLKESQNVHAIKLNITSRCNVPQIYTKVTSRIQKIENNREVVAQKFPSRVAASTAKSPETAVFKNIFINCVPGVEVAYKGFAKGYVLLKNGEKIKVVGTSGNYEATDCEIGAQ